MADINFIYSFFGLNDLYVYSETLEQAECSVEVIDQELQFLRRELLRVDKLLK